MYDILYSVVIHSGSTPLLDLLAKAGGWALANITSKMPWKYSQIAMDQMMGSQALFSMSVGADSLNSSVQSISVSQQPFGP